MYHNPLLRREFRQRMRTGRAPAIVTGYLAGMTGLTFALLYESMQGQLLLFQPARSEQVFAMLSMLQLTVALFLTPAFAAGAISGERERRTLPVLLTTPLTPADILLGKVISSSALLILLLITALPLYSLVFLFGGAVPQEVLAVFAFQLFTIVVVAALSVMWSSISLRSGWSTVLSYATVAWMLIITGVVGYGLRWLAAHYAIDFFAFRWAIVLLHLNPLWVLATLENLVSDPGWPPGWLVFCGFYMGLLVVLTIPAVWRLRPRPPRWWAGAARKSTVEGR